MDSRSSRIDNLAAVEAFIHLTIELVVTIKQYRLRQECLQPTLNPKIDRSTKAANSNLK